LGTESAFEVLARARALELTGAKVIHLEIGEPDFATPPHVVAAADEALAAGHTHYVPAPGIPELRPAVAAVLGRPRRLRTRPPPAGPAVREPTGRRRPSPDRVVVTPGAKPIMFFTILALCQEGDEVLYP